MNTLEEAFDRPNLERAWRWIKSNPDAGYKNYCRCAYSRYALADAALLDQLENRLSRGIYEPTHACKLLHPKKSGILRPYTLLTVEDQIVYQAMVNVIAERLAPRVRHQYLMVTFGHMYAGHASDWFYKPWKTGYSAFNDASRNSFKRGLTFTASFDLTACYDSLDYGVLCHFLDEIKCDREFCEQLKEYFGFWTATSTRIYHSHGIPQGPLGSGLLAEVVLRHFDLNYGSKSNVRYLRYVDDIRLFAKREEDLRRMLVRLDTLSKDIGLFPQAAKINIHEIEDIEEELKSVSNPYESDDEDEAISYDQTKLRRELITLSPRFKVEKTTQFKFFLAQADPSSKLNSRLLRISKSRPDLIPAVMRYLKKYDRLPSAVALELLHRLKSVPLYQNITAEIIATLDQRMPRAHHTAMRRILKRLWRPTALAPELLAALGKPLFRDKVLDESRIRYALRSIPDWWVRAELYSVLNHQSFGTVFLSNVLNSGLRDGVCDAALSATETLASIGIAVDKPLSNLHPAAARALRQLGLISRLPRGVDGIERSMGRLIGKSTGVNWRAVFGKDYKHAERQAVLCRALADTNATAFVNAMDVFNDILLSRLYLHDRSLGTYSLGSLGSVLSSLRLKASYPHTFTLVSDIHEKRYVSNLSHARARRTGRPTGRIKYKYVKKVRGIMARSFFEIAASW